MADTAPTTVTERSTESRIIRVFLSSTFRDFMEERDLLVNRIFPKLRRDARERGVEVVEVDLRWGITEEESRQGKVLPICLAEIDRCRPGGFAGPQSEADRERIFFICMLGERYGWIPPADHYLPEVIDDQPWVKEHQGQRSVTELEILHGVLNNPEMAGRAFFYFRDPDWSQQQQESWFRCDNDAEQEKLSNLKQRIRDSRFPVVETDLPNPEALARRIGEDLWALIEEQFPEIDQPDALEREERKHASYRRARTELYVDGTSGDTKVSQLEQWITAGQQKILITGESGAGKSALIANWIEVHRHNHPEDVVFAHHLGCSNDANALEPMLARMVQTASKLMADESDAAFSEPIKVPQDYWELVSTVTDTLSKLSDWCKTRGCHWIWVLDGLDRQPEDNQQALPWLPLQLFSHLHVVISALDCRARTILQERDYTTLTIGQLELEEQQALIQATMRRYTKTLPRELEEKILKQEQARSPLYLRVVLDELRVCGRHETLPQQLDEYLKAQTVDALYAKVLERLEGDVGLEAVEKVMTAVWASRAGLSEPELLAITKVKRLQWAPIDLGLEGSFGRNGTRLVFDHDYLRQAVKERYLPSEEAQRQAHSSLADWFGTQQSDDDAERDERKAEEWPWQLQQAERLSELRGLLLNVSSLYELAKRRRDRETINYWLDVKGLGDGELDELIADDLEEEIEKRREDADDLIWFADRIAGLFNEAGLYRKPLLKLRALSLELEEASDDRSEESMLSSLAWLANAHRDMGNFNEAEPLNLRCLEARERLLGPEHPSTLTTVSNLAGLFQDKGDYEQAEAYYKRALEARERLLGPEHPDALATLANLAGLFQDRGDYEQAEAFYKRALEASERLLGPEHPSTLTTVGNLGQLYSDKGDYEQAESFYSRCLEARERLLGPEHPDTFITIGNLAALFHAKGDYEQAEVYYKRDLEASERLLGPEHPSTLTTVGNLGLLYSDKGDYEQAEAYYNQALETSERLLGPEHPSTLTTIGNLGLLYSNKGDYEQAEFFYKRNLEASERLLGPEHPDTLTTVNNLGWEYRRNGDYEQAQAYLTRCLEAFERLLGPEHPSTLTTVSNLGLLYSDKGDYEQAQAYLIRCLEAFERLLGPEHRSTLTSVNNLGLLYRRKGDYKQAEFYYTRCLEAFERLLGPEHPDTAPAAYSLADVLSQQGRPADAIPLRRRELVWRRQKNGDTDLETLSSINGLAIDLRETGALEEAEELFRELLAARMQVLEPSDVGIGRALVGLATTLEEAGSLEEAAAYRQQALNFLLKHEGPDAWWTNEARLDLARVLHKLGRSAEALSLLDLLEMIMKEIVEPVNSDRMLLEEVQTLRNDLESSKN